MTFALIIHLAVWWVPVSLPAMELEPPRVVRISIMKPPPRRPKIKPPKRRITKPKPRRKIRRKRRYKKRRRYRRKRRIRKRRKPLKRVVKPQPPPKKPRRVAARKTIKPQPMQPAPRPIKRVAPAPPPRRIQQQPAPRVNIRGYGFGVYRSIQRHKRYPLMAYKMRFEGQVILSIRIARSGKLLGRPRIVRSSGHSILDQEAVRMVLAAAPMRPIPRGYHRPYVTFKIPIKFRIRR